MEEILSKCSDKYTVKSKEAFFVKYSMKCLQKVVSSVLCKQIMELRFVMISLMMMIGVIELLYRTTDITRETEGDISAGYKCANLSLSCSTVFGKLATQASCFHKPAGNGIPTNPLAPAMEQLVIYCINILASFLRSWMSVFLSRKFNLHEALNPCYLYMQDFIANCMKEFDESGGIVQFVVICITKSIEKRIFQDISLRMDPYWKKAKEVVCSETTGNKVTESESTPDLESDGSDLEPSKIIHLLGEDASLSSTIHLLGEDASLSTNSNDIEQQSRFLGSVHVQSVNDSPCSSGSEQNIEQQPQVLGSVLVQPRTDYPCSGENQHNTKKVLEQCYRVEDDRGSNEHALSNYAIFFNTQPSGCHQNGYFSDFTSQGRVGEIRLKQTHPKVRYKHVYGVQAAGGANRHKPLSTTFWMCVN